MKSCQLNSRRCTMAIIHKHEHPPSSHQCRIQGLLVLQECQAKTGQMDLRFKLWENMAMNCSNERLFNSTNWIKNPALHFMSKLASTYLHLELAFMLNPLHFPSRLVSTYLNPKPKLVYILSPSKQRGATHPEDEPSTVLSRTFHLQNRCSLKQQILFSFSIYNVITSKRD